MFARRSREGQCDPASEAPPDEPPDVSVEVGAVGIAVDDAVDMPPASDVSIPPGTLGVPGAPPHAIPRAPTPTATAKSAINAAFFMVVISSTLKHLRHNNAGVYARVGPMRQLNGAFVVNNERNERSAIRKKPAPNSGAELMVNRHEA